MPTRQRYACPSSSAIILAAAALLVAALACQATGTSQPPAGPVPFRDQSFELQLPAWPEAQFDDDTLMAISPGGQVIAVARHQATPRSVGAYLATLLPDYGPFTDILLHDRHPDDVRLEARLSGEVAQQARFHLRYCDGYAYQVTGLAPAGSFAGFETILEETLARARCLDEPARAATGRGLVGLSINPSHDEYEFASFRSAIRLAAAARVRAAHVALTWGELEKEPGIYDWTIPDYILDPLWLEGMHLSLVFDFIHTSVPGKMPPDLEGRPFDDPAVTRRAGAFLAAVAIRYGDQLDYLALGNEVDIYLSDHPEALASFLTLFDAGRGAVAAVRPDLPVGTTLAFQEMLVRGRLDLVEPFKRGDFLGYTYYPHGPGLRYDGDTGLFAGILAQMEQVSGQTPFLVVETGWATGKRLGGTEALQAAYVEAVFDAVGRWPEFTWLVWYNMHDGRADNCATIALTFVPPDFDVAAAGEGWGAFEEYLCTLGLRHNDGRPKQAWHIFSRAAGAIAPPP